MACFGEKESWYLTRVSLGVDGDVLPWTVDDAMAAIFPECEQWIGKCRTPGAVDEGAEPFLFKVLPFLTLVAIQDGIYWVRDFPQHPVSLLLKQCLRGYEVWAQVAWRKCVKRTANIKADKIAALDAGTQAAFVCFNRRVDTIDSTLQQHGAQLEQIATVQQQNANLLRQVLVGQ